MKGQHGFPNFIGNRAVFILSTVLEVHKHVDLDNYTCLDYILLKKKMAHLKNFEMLPAPAVASEIRGSCGQSRLRSW